jgi:hypothetical protein
LVFSLHRSSLTFGAANGKDPTGIADERVPGHIAPTFQRMSLQKKKSRIDPSIRDFPFYPQNLVERSSVLEGIALVIRQVF